MAWYRTGRASSVAGSNVITGVGTLWANNVFGIAPGQTLSIPGAGQVLQYEILAVDSDTKIRIATNVTTTITNSEYAIVTTVANSYSALARQTSANLAVYEKLLSDWQDITTGTGDVTIIAPDGSTVVIPSLSDLTAWVNDSKTWFDDNRELIDNAGEAVTGAETARDEAVAAKTAAQSAEAAAEGSATSASGSATAASDAAATAKDSASTASGAATIATQSKDGAVAARNEAEQFAASVNPDLLMHTTGGTFTGPVILAGDAIDDMEPVTKQQFESKSGIPLGMSWFHDSRDHLPEGTAAKDGQLLSRALFPDMWAELAAGLRPMIDDATWLANPHARASFSSGDGSTTFRLPDWNGKSVGSWAAGVPRGDGLNSTGIPGNMQADAIRNITGAFSSDLGGSVWLGATATSGVFSSASSQPSNIFQPNDGTFSRVTANGSFTIDASRQVPTASENRMVNFTGVWVIKLAGGALNEGQINALELATQITALSSRLGILEADAFTNAKMVNTPWINLTLGGGWSGSVYRYRKVLGMAQLQVSIVKQSVVNGEVVATLPSGYRPTAIVQAVVFATFSTPSGGGATYPARVIVSQDGALVIHQTNGATELNFVLMFPLQ
ncbi:TPA: phage tail protein [Yersinia enterocolitica]